MFRVAYSVRILVLAGFVASHLGLPTIEPAQHLASGKYPCQGHQCGCMSAEHCWQHCCCMSLEDRLAWAERNDVTPPDGIALTGDHSFVQEHPKSCCADLVANESVLAKPSDAKAAPRFQWMLTIEAMKCRGQSFYWMVVAQPALATDASVQCDLNQPMCGHSHRIEDHLEEFSLAPPLPYG